MIQKKMFGLIVALFLASLFASAQNHCSCKEMIGKIDSIAKNSNIDTGVILYNEVSSRFDNTYTDVTTLSNKGKFVFDGNFLVIDNKYFNLEKLLYFKIEKDYFKFYFQGY
ncbi:MAG: hypothetical protein JXJ22_17660 [Bacteroidales bacterium]|nr:hypothetical protein [Bacteroidales bacterium]